MMSAIAELWASLFTMFSMVTKTAAALDAVAGIAKAEAEGTAALMAEERGQRFDAVRAKRQAQ